MYVVYEAHAMTAHGFCCSKESADKRAAVLNKRAADGEDYYVGKEFYVEREELEE